MKRRIRRYNSLNWSIEEYRKGGKALPGRPGKVSKGGWWPMAYFNRFSKAAEYLLDQKLGDTWNEQQPLEAIRGAWEGALAEIRLSADREALRIETLQERLTEAEKA